MNYDDFASTCDLYDEYLTRARVPSTVLSHFGGRTKFSGIATTIKCFEDNSRVREFAQMPGAGKVMVVDGDGSYQCALVGDVIAGMACDNGWEGIVIFGCVRDSVELAKLDIGVIALATTPKKSVRKDVGEAELAIMFDDTVCNPGDRVFVDEDGVLLLDGSD